MGTFRLVCCSLVLLCCGCAGVPLSTAWDLYRTDANDLRTLPGNEWRLLLESEDGVFPQTVSGAFNVGFVRAGTPPLELDIPFEFLLEEEGRLLLKPEDPESIDAFFTKTRDIQEADFVLKADLKFCDDKKFF